MNGFLITLEPVVARAGPVTLRWFGVLLLAGVGLGLWLTIRRAEGRGISRRAVVELASWVVPIGLVGARLLYVVENWEYYLTTPGEVLDLGSGGLSSWGALLAGSLAVWRLGRDRWRFRVLADAAAPGLVLGEAIGRFGTFLNGDGQGRPSSVAWATRYSSNDALTPDFGVPRHPAQVYQLMADVAILGVLWLLRGTELAIGVRFWLCTALYAVSRVGIGVVRLDPPFLLGLQQAQLIGIGVGVIAVLAMIRAARRGSPNPNPPAEGEGARARSPERRGEDAA